MIKSRNRNAVIKSQFNIHGSRGRDAGKFISDYVSRPDATEPSMAYVPDPNTVPVEGDGVAFTLDQTAITRKETLEIADHVQELHATGKRAIQQMVISFDPDYLVEEKIVPENVEVLEKGDYKGNYDDVRLRNVVRTGLQSLIDQEGYRDGKAVACIQADTHHLHVHAVVYEDAKKLGRVRGSEEKGLIKESSFNQMAFDMHRKLELTKTLGSVPTQKALEPEQSEENTHEEITEVAKEPEYVDRFYQIIQRQRKQKKQQQLAIKKRQRLEKAKAQEKQKNKRILDQRRKQASKRDEDIRQNREQLRRREQNRRFNKNRGL